MPSASVMSDAAANPGLLMSPRTRADDVLSRVRPTSRTSCVGLDGAGPLKGWQRLDGSGREGTPGREGTTCREGTSCREGTCLSGGHYLSGGCSLVGRAPPVGRALLVGRVLQLKRIVQPIQHRADSSHQFERPHALLSFQKAVSEAHLEFGRQLAVRAHRDRDVVLVRLTATLPSPALGNVRRDGDDGSPDLTLQVELDAGHRVRVSEDAVDEVH